MLLRELSSLIGGVTICGWTRMNENVEFAFASNLMSDVLTVKIDNFKKVLDYKHSVLLVPTIFFAQFKGILSVEEVCYLIGDMGFSEVCAVEQSVDVLIDDINEYVEKVPKPVIYSFCPAVTRLIQVHFSSLVDHLMLLLPRRLKSWSQYGAEIGLCLQR